VQAVLARFPGAEVVDVRQAGAQAMPDGAAAEPPLADETAYGADWQPDEIDDNDS